MVDAIINIELATGLGLPYAIGAELALTTVDTLAFDAVSTAAGVPLTLAPGFDLPVDEIADLLCAARQSGTEPPDLFAWYSTNCPEDTVDAVVATLQALPFVLQADRQAHAVVAGWEVATDPDCFFQQYLRTGPEGVSAYLAWQLPGGAGQGARVADVEHGWDLTHPELLGVVTPLTVLPTWETKAHIDHGTAAIGVIGSQANGRSLTGIAPHAALSVAYAGRQVAAAIVRAAGHVGRGGIVLIELAGAIRINNQLVAAFPLEHDPIFRTAIDLAASLGVLLVEPAGNAKINLDTDPRFPDLRGVPIERRSRALVVAAGERSMNANGDETGAWMAASFTTGGARVNCFAAGVSVIAPLTGSIRGITRIGGTSAASAIVAGIAAALQGISIASDHGLPLDGADIHARLADPQFGHLATAVSPTNPQSIGVLPDLAKLAEGIGVPCIFPVSSIRVQNNHVIFMRPQSGDVNQLEFLEYLGWNDEWVKSGTSTDIGRLANGVGHAVGLHHFRLDDGNIRIDAVVTTDQGGICHRRLFLGLLFVFDQGGGAIAWSTFVAQQFKISAPMTVAAQGAFMLVAGLSASDQAMVLVAERKPDSNDVVPMAMISHTDTGHEPSLVVIDPLERFNIPPVVYDHNGAIVLVGVDRSGWIRFAQWTEDFGWTTLEIVAGTLDPVNAPAIASDGPALYVVGYDSAAEQLREIVRSPDADALFQWSAQRTIAEPPLITWGSPLVPAGPIAMASDGAGTLMAMALTAAGLPMFTVRPVGLDWTPAFWVPCLTTFVLRGGLTVASPSPGVFFAAASDARGTLHIARWTFVGWTPFAPPV